MSWARMVQSRMKASPWVCCRLLLRPTGCRVSKPPTGYDLRSSVVGSPTGYGYPIPLGNPIFPGISLPYVIGQKRPNFDPFRTPIFEGKIDPPETPPETPPPPPPPGGPGVTFFRVFNNSPIRDRWDRSDFWHFSHFLAFLAFPPEPIITAL